MSRNRIEDDVEQNRRLTNTSTTISSGNKDKIPPTLSKKIFCFVGLQVSYVVWGVIQENLMTREYKFGKFKSSSFCVFANRFLALIIAFLIVFVRRMMNPTKPVADAPFYCYAPNSLSNTISSWAQYEALKFISFPTQVLSKSCKIIPVMLVGIVLNRKSYPIQEYVEALLITTGVAVFTFSTQNPHGDSSEREDTFYGISLLALYLLCDSFTSQWQSRVYKQYQIDQYQMMLGANVWSMLLTGVTLLQSGEFFHSFALLIDDYEAMYHMIILSITSATGQLFIYYTVKELGAVNFTIFMTTRQLISLFVSCILFQHSFNAFGWLSSIFVFAVVLRRIYYKGTD